MAYTIRPLAPADREWVSRLIAEQWGSTRIVTRGVLYDAADLPGFAAFDRDTPVGLVTWHKQGDEVEIISLNSLVQGAGIGTALMGTVVKQAAAENCRRVWLITTNDNTNALRFYQKNGFHFAALYRNALEASRRLKPEIPLRGMDGIPLRDEIELELVLK